MAYAKGKHPGTVWRKSDLQCHSPRDRNWTGDPSLPGGSQQDEDARRAWARSFVAECVSRGITVFAITDHHDMSFVPYLLEARDENASALDLLAYPGVEVTCSDNTQCLVLFDPSAPHGDWLHFLGKLRGVNQTNAQDAKTAPVMPADMTIKELIDEVAQDARLKDICTILPHFSDGDAHKHLNQDGHHGRFAALECDGVYIEKPYSALDPVTREKAYGVITDWGTRRRAFVATGDNRSGTWERLGAHDCWIKLGENSVEALRQALLADEARIAYVAPTLPPDRIVELRVRSTLTGDGEFALSLNEGFNALIGGRGSGKSALLQYLRFGLGRTARDFAHDEDSREDYDREKELIDATLKDGYVEVDVEREGVFETWRRSLAERDVIRVAGADTAVQTITINDAQRRFRARAFHQKGLSTTMSDAGSAAEQITGIAAAEQLDQRRQIDDELVIAKRAVATALRQQSAYWQSLLDVRRAEGVVLDLRRRIAAVNARLQKEGVSPEALAILAQAPIFERAKAYQSQVARTLEVETKRLEQAKSNALGIPIAQFESVNQFTELAQLDDAIVAARAKIVGLIDSALSEVRALSDVAGTAASAFETRLKAFGAEYDAARVAQQAHKVLVAELERLNSELRAAEAAELEVKERAEAQKECPARFKAACVELSRLIGERHRVLSLAAHQVEALSNGLLKAKHKADPCPSEYVSALENLFAGARIHDVAEKSGDWVRELVRHNAAPSWETVKRELLNFYETKIAAGSPSAPGEESASSLRNLIFSESSLTPQQLQRVYQNLDDDALAMIFAAVPRDYIVLTYVDQGRDVPFEQASPGQQASALLELLLKQAAGTLIIDQPEDDLDNRIIMQIVKLIRTSKSGRQLVFATHNPNIVVNGDADKVIALASSERRGEASSARVQIEVDGAIESPAVRKTITHIMEGGKEAFDLRSRKYGFPAT